MKLVDKMDLLSDLLGFCASLIDDCVFLIILYYISGLLHALLKAT